LSACAEQSQSDIQTVQSAVGTHASFIRSYTQANGNQAVIFRDNTGGITEVDPTFHSMGAHEDGGPPWGFRRSDNVNSVVYVANNQRIHELTPTSGQNNFVDNDFF